MYCNYLYIIPSLYTIAFNANSIEFALALNNILEFEESNGNYKMWLLLQDLCKKEWMNEMEVSEIFLRNAND